MFDGHSRRLGVNTNTYNIMDNNFQSWMFSYCVYCLKIGGAVVPLPVI